MKMSFKPRKVMRVSLYGDPVLRRAAASIKKVDDKIRRLAKAMQDTMAQEDGLGLAAPQVGVPLRLIALAVPPPKAGAGGKYPPLSAGERLLLPKMPMVLVNPEIVSRGGAIIEKDEGCLSVPEIYAPVPRPSTIILTAETLDGERLDSECGGFLARVLQHELDHLDGVLFIDHLAAPVRERFASAIVRIERRGEKNAAPVGLEQKFIA